MNIVNISVFDNYDKKLDEILKDATYSEVCNYLKLLPYPQSDLYTSGMDYMNQFYKMANRLFEQKEKTTDIEIKIQIDNQLHAVYFGYCYLDYHDTVLSYKEFITFSRILCTWFDDYNPRIQREDDDSFHTQEKWIENLIKAIAYNSQHSPHPHAFEYDKTKLELLIEKLGEKANQILDSYFDNHRIINYQTTLEESAVTHQAKEKIAQYIKERTHQ